MSQEKPTAEELARLSKPVYAPRKKWQRPPVKDQDAPPADGDGKAKELQTALWEDPAAEAARSAASGSEHRTAAAAGGDGPLFQYYGHCSDKEVSGGIPSNLGRVYGAEDCGETVGSAYLIRPCRCRRGFCEYCGPRLGYALRNRLALRLRHFNSVFGITLTVDGTLFPSPEAAWSYFSNGGLIGRFVRDLDRRGHLHSKAYFWVVEFQKDTEQPHWHLLLDAGRIPFGEIVEIYSRYRPKDAPPLDEPITAENYQGRPPAFGSVHFSPPADPLSAAIYATKYLTKFPEHGFPDWVLDRKGRVPRFNHSRGFFPLIPGHDPMCFCEECRGAIEVMKLKREKKEAKKKEEETESEKRVPTSARQRLDRCGQNCTMVKVNRVQLADGTIVDGRSEFIQTLKISYREACEVAGEPPEVGSRLELTWEQANAVARYVAGYDDEGEAA